MQTGELGIVCQTGGTAGGWYTGQTGGAVFMGGNFGLPSIGDLGIVVNGKFLQVDLTPPETGDKMLLLNAPVKYGHEYCIALEPPKLLPYLEGGYYNKDYTDGKSFMVYSKTYYFLDTPLESDPDFDPYLKNDPGYVENKTGVTLWSKSEDDLPEGVEIQYWYMVSDEYNIYDIALPHPELSNQPADHTEYPIEFFSTTYNKKHLIEQSVYTTGGTPDAIGESVWAGEKFIPPLSDKNGAQINWLACVACAEGRLISQASFFKHRILPGRFFVSYSASTKQITLSASSPNVYGDFLCRNYASTTLNVFYAGGALLDSRTGTITESGTVKIFYYDAYLYYLPEGETASYDAYPLFVRDIDIDNTESFDEVIWMPNPVANMARTEQPRDMLAVKFPPVELDADYYISPDGTGDGLTPETPSNWKDLFGQRYYYLDAEHNPLYTDTAGSITGNVSGNIIKVRATVGDYTVDTDSYGFFPRYVHLIGGHNADFTNIVGKSNLKSNVSASSGYDDNIIENFDFEFFAKEDEYTWDSSAEYPWKHIWMTLNHGDSFLAYYQYIQANYRNCNFKCAAADDSWTYFQRDADDYTVLQAELSIQGNFFGCTFDINTSHCNINGRAMFNCTGNITGVGEIVYPQFIEHVRDVENLWDETNHVYLEPNYLDVSNITGSIYSTGIVSFFFIGRSDISITNVLYGSATGTRYIKKSKVIVSTIDQQEGRVKSYGNDAFIELARTAWQRPDGTYYDTWYEAATDVGHTYHDNPEWAYVDINCYHWVYAKTTMYCALSTTASVVTGFSLDNDIKINVGKVPNGGNGGNCAMYETTYPEETYWDWDWETETEIEVTIPAHDMRIWKFGAEGQGETYTTATIKMPKYMRNTKLKVNCPYINTGGNGGNGDTRDVDWVAGEEVTDDDGYFVQINEYTSRNGRNYKASGMPGMGGAISIESPVMWTPDCSIDINICNNGMSGTNNLCPDPAAMTRSGFYSHPDGDNFVLWDGIEYFRSDSDLDYYCNELFGPKDGYYGGNGGRSADALGYTSETYYVYNGNHLNRTYPNGGNGGDGIPVDGFRTPGVGGGGTATNGVQRGSYWE